MISLRLSSVLALVYFDKSLKMEGFKFERALEGVFGEGRSSSQVLMKGRLSRRMNVFEVSVMLDWSSEIWELRGMSLPLGVYIM